MSKSVLATALLLSGVLLAAITSPAGAQDGPTVFITSPAEGATVQFPLTVTGTIDEGIDPAEVWFGWDVGNVFTDVDLEIAGDGTFTTVLNWSLPTLPSSELFILLDAAQGRNDSRNLVLTGLPVDQEAPEFVLSVPGDPADLPLTLSGRVTDATGIGTTNQVGIPLLVATTPDFGYEQTILETSDLDADGSFTITLDPSLDESFVGDTLVLTGFAMDTYDNLAEFERTITLANVVDNTPPQITITRPTRTNNVSYPVTMAGSVVEESSIASAWIEVTYVNPEIPDPPTQFTVPIRIHGGGDRWSVEFDPRLVAGWRWSERGRFDVMVWMTDSRDRTDFESTSFNTREIVWYCVDWAVTVDLSQGDVPTDGPDIILGTLGDDVIDAGAGDDVVCGRDGNDQIWGGKGADILAGEAGRDRIRGGVGNDLVSGGTGRDRIRLGRGTDIGWGDGGRDRMFGDAGADALFGMGGNDRLSGGSGDDFLDGGIGTNVGDAGAGIDACERVTARNCER
jgi:hypothetical protein